MRKNIQEKNSDKYAEKRLMKSLMKIKTTVRSGITVNTQGNIWAAYSICYVRYKMPKKLL